MGGLFDATNSAEEFLGGYPAALPSVVYRPLTVSYIPPIVTRPWGLCNRKYRGQRETTPNAWPQRLLHVQSMTSVGCYEGGSYGGRARPSYNALSYSWGQYRVLPGRRRGKRSSQAFHINGLPPGWSSTPVLLSHYTPADLDRVVHLCVGEPPSALVGAGREQEFLWLDQAGVDQRDVSPRNTELRRQGLIFQKARHSFVWFTRLGRESLTAICNGLPAAAREAQAEYLARTTTRRMAWASETASLVLRIATDPWFRGLWTLQEAFFSADAFLISREAQLIEVPCEQGRQAATLRTLTDACGTILRCCQNYIHLEKSPPTPASEAVSKCIEVLKMSGLATLAFPHPINFYSAARYRITTAGDLDYLEAITQIFGIELDMYGEDRISDPVCAGEMEVRIGALMLENDPVRSQLHCFTTPVAFGSGWRFNGSSLVPIFPGGLRCILDSTVETLCSFSVEVAEGQHWGGLSGMGCRATELNSYLAGISDQAFPPALMLALDSQDGKSLPFPDELPCFFAFDRLSQFDTSCEFIRLSQKMIVFHLGRISYDSADQFDTGPRKRRLEAGLLLIPGGGHPVQCWRRVGCCLWDILEDATNENYRGRWERISGIFG